MTTAVMYEWSGTQYRELSKEPITPSFLAGFKAGSTHRWNYWDLVGVNRAVGGAGTLLSTPYSMDARDAILAAGLERKTDDIDEPSEFVFVNLATSTVVKTINIGRSIVGLSWDPTSEAIVVMSRSASYPKRTIRSMFAAAIGHPISYNDIFLDVIALDGSRLCSISPVSSVPYGTGLVRWEAK